MCKYACKPDSVLKDGYLSRPGITTKVRAGLSILRRPDRP